MKRQPFQKVSDAIRDAYRKVPSRTLRARPPLFTRDCVLSITAKGLGDCVALSDLPRAGIEQGRKAFSWSGSPHFDTLMKLNPAFQTHHEISPPCPWLVDGLRLVEQYDCGNGHVIQRLRRAWGFEVADRPSGSLLATSLKRSNRVLLHFEPAATNVEWQRKHWHPRMRELYDESQAVLEQFIDAHSELEFIEVGMTPRRVAGATHVTCPTLPDLVNLVNTCSWFIGIMSGPLHLAVATGAKCIVICNHPHAARIVLPTLVRTGTPEEEWYYPQNVHLHQESETVLVPRLSTHSLEAAFNGEVYPYWSDHFLPLIHECN